MWRDPRDRGRISLFLALEFGKFSRRVTRQPQFTPQSFPGRIFEHIVAADHGTPKNAFEPCTRIGILGGVLAWSIRFVLAPVEMGTRPPVGRRFMARNVWKPHGSSLLAGHTPRLPIHAPRRPVGLRRSEGNQAGWRSPACCCSISRRDSLGSRKISGLTVLRSLSGICA